MFTLKDPKSAKGHDDLTVFLRFWDLLKLKLHINMLVKANPEVLLSPTEVFKKPEGLR